MDVEEIVALHVARFLAASSRMALMIADLEHVNSESKEMKEENERIYDIIRDAFKAKNVLANAKYIIELDKK